jgi:tetratricopeptide (TPR) repeat protein
VLTNIGKTYHDWKQYERAQPMMEQAVATALREEELIAAGYALNALTMLQIDRGDYSRAQQYLDESSPRTFAPTRS